MKNRNYQQYPLLPIVLFIVGVMGWILANPSPALSQGATVTTFPVGAGFTDVVPRQIVRANNDRVYVFGPRAQTTTGIAAYWTTTAGLPSGTASFTGTTTFNDTNKPLSLDAVYDGASTIHVLVNNNGGVLNDFPFDVTTNTFKPAITLATGNPTVATTDYIGTSGVSGMVDLNGTLHVAYWAAGNHIVHRSYTYNAANNALTPASSATQLDSAGSANHPSLVVSPVDNSVLVAWVSEATNPARILAITRSAAGTWGAIETVSTAPVWTSPAAGINIDQGPSIIVDDAGGKHLAYIENYDNTGQYGRVHYVTNSGGGWVDTIVPTYTHDPALAINDQGDIYIIGHGPLQTNQAKNMYYMEKTGANSWGALQLVATPGAGASFDASVSVKWSAVGFNRADVVEFLYFLANANGGYNNTTIYYGRLEAAGGPRNPTDTPVSSPTPLPPSATPVPPSATPVPNDLIFKDGFESGTLSAWPGSFTDNNSLLVNATAALIGTRGMAAVINDNNNVYSLDGTPNNEARYRARFYFDPNAISMANNTAHYIFFGTSPSSGIVRVEFGRINNAYSIRAGLINDASAWTDSSWFAISDAPHFIEFDWAASSAPNANNGNLTLWIDAIQRAAITGMDNDTRRIDSAVLGAITGVDTTTRGTYYLDEFESRRQTYIGPVGGTPPTATPPAFPTNPPQPSVTPSPTNTAPPPPTLPGGPSATPIPSVTPRNRPPIAGNDTLGTAKNTALTINPATLLANDSDPDGNALTIMGFTPPAHGTISQAGGNGVYTPTTNYTGTDSFTYTISDGRGGTATATVTINVGP